MLDENWENPHSRNDTPKEIINSATLQRFTLDPTYTHYELGGVEMEYETVYGRPDSGVSESAVWIVSGVTAMLGLCSQNGAFTFAFWIAVLIGMSIYSWRITTKLKEQAEVKLQALRQTNVLLDGELLSFEIVNELHLHRAFVDARKPYVKVTFQFKTPDNRTVYAEQRRLLDKEWRRPKPTQGTPIRVLYADPETYVML